MDGVKRGGGLCQLAEHSINTGSFVFPHCVSIYPVGWGGGSRLLQQTVIVTTCKAGSLAHNLLCLVACNLQISVYILTPCFLLLLERGRSHTARWGWLVLAASTRKSVNMSPPCHFQYKKIHNKKTTIVLVLFDQLKEGVTYSKVQGQLVLVIDMSDKIP